LRAHVGGSRLEHRIREIHTDDAVDGRAELEAHGLAARGSLHEHLRRRQSIAARQRPVIELEGEVAAPALERRDRARDVESPELVRDGGQTRGGHEPHPGQTLLSGILVAVTVRVVEDLADHVRAIEGEIRHHADRLGGLFRYRTAAYPGEGLSVVHELAFAYPRALDEHQHYGVVRTAREASVARVVSEPIYLGMCRCVVV